MNLKIRRLPDGELEVMQAVWSVEPPVLRSDLERLLKEKHPLAATTILTLLSRLVEKGFLKLEKTGRSNAYTPLISKEDYLASQSRRFLDKLCGGDMGVFAAALCSGGLSREELKELRELLEKGEL